MAEELAAVIERARRARSAGRLREALAGFARAATTAKATALTGEWIAALEGVGQVERDLGRAAAACASYREAIEVCRGANEPLRLAHALRHLADIERERGNAEEALGPACEAVALYRQHPGVPSLELANALRVWALVQEMARSGAGATAAWQEARQLYAAAGIEAGVSECQAHLAART